MTKEGSFDNAFVEKTLSAGSKIAEKSGRIGEIGLSALKKMMDSQFALTSAFVELGTGQFRSLGQIAAPGEFLQCQKVLGEAFNEKLNGYVEGVREIGVETQAAYAAVTKEFAADLGLKTA